MKKTFLALLALVLCFSSCLCLAACQKKISEEEWHAAFAFENVRVDCTITHYQKEPSAKDPIYGGTHYLLNGDVAAVAEVEQQLIGEPSPTYYELLYQDRRELVRLFDFANLFKEFEKQENGTYFCETPSHTDIIWVGDYIQNATVSFTKGKIAKITYTYYSAPLVQPTVYTFTFSQYGEITLDAPAE